MGKTGRNFQTRYKEHIREIRYNKPKKGYGQHMLNTGHKYRNIEDTMDVVEQQPKGPYLDTIDT
jgi:hypothetical protein